MSTAGAAGGPAGRLRPLRSRRGLPLATLPPPRAARPMGSAAGDYSIAAFADNAGAPSEPAPGGPAGGGAKRMAGRGEDLLQSRFAGIPGT